MSSMRGKNSYEFKKKNETEGMTMVKRSKRRGESWKGRLEGKE